MENRGDQEPKRELGNEEIKSEVIRIIEDSFLTTFDEVNEEREVLCTQNDIIFQKHNIEKIVESIRRSRFVPPKEISEILGIADAHEKIGGFTHTEWTSKKSVEQYALVEDTGTPAKRTYTLLHESIHLLNPPHIVHHGSHPMGGVNAYVLKLGPVRMAEVFDNGHTEQYYNYKYEEKLFWEAVTDWFAIILLKQSGKFSDQETEYIEYFKLDKDGDGAGGFAERLLLEYLFKKSPDKQELIRAFKTALIGGMDTVAFSDILQKMTKTNENIYQELLDVLKNLREDCSNWDETDDKWCEIVDKHFGK